MSNDPTLHDHRDSIDSVYWGNASGTTGGNVTIGYYPWCPHCASYHFGACNNAAGYPYWYQWPVSDTPKIVKEVEFYEDGELVKKELYYE